MKLVGMQLVENFVHGVQKAPLQTSEEYSTAELFPNFRDFGGLACEDGRCIRPGKIYRTSKLSLKGGPKERAVRKQAIEELDLDTIIDFRSPAERKEKPDYVPKGVRYEHVPFFSKGEVELILVTRKSIFQMITLRGARIPLLREAKDRSYALMPFDNDQIALKALFDALDRGDTIAFHCTEGKDRTGFAAYVLERCLGRSDEAAREEYLKSNASMDEKMERQARLLRLWHTPEELIDSLNYAEHCYNSLLDLSLNAIQEQYGTLENYLLQVYGVTEERKATWQERYLSQ